MTKIETLLQKRIEFLAVEEKFKAFKKALTELGFIYSFKELHIFTFPESSLGFYYKIFINTDMQVCSAESDFNRKNGRWNADEGHTLDYTFTVHDADILTISQEIDAQIARCFYVNYPK